MPNRCSNKIVISGDADIIANIAKRMMQDDGEYRFFISTFIPMPSALNGIMLGSFIDETGEHFDNYRYAHKVTGEILYNIENTYVDSNDNEVDADCVTKVPLSTMEKDLLRNAYGATNWHEWRNNNWGIKWDLRAEQQRVEVDKNEICIWCDTPWAPPVDALLKMSKIKCFQGLTLINHFAEQGMGILGTIKCFAGESEDIYSYCGSFYDVPENMSEEEKEAYWDDPTLVEEVEFFIKIHGIGTGG